ncbi:hypothetical protein EDC04DRAFT_3024814 [Pisolithus marmoratus]|nr:hypothetical protein EDC04DRAFT_3024814 [Pisolithus marmoratus]
MTTQAGEGLNPINCRVYDMLLGKATGHSGTFEKRLGNETHSGYVCVKKTSYVHPILQELVMGFEVRGNKLFIENLSGDSGISSLSLLTIQMFKKLSKSMGNKLDREKGRSIEELEAPDFKHNTSTDLICQCAAKHEHSCPKQHTQQADLKPCPKFKEAHHPPPIPKTGTTSATATSTPNANTAMTDPKVMTNPNTGVGAHLTSTMIHTKSRPSAGMHSHPSLTLRPSSHSTQSPTAPSATVLGVLGVGCGASSMSTPDSGNINGNGTNGVHQQNTLVWTVLDKPPQSLIILTPNPT